MALQRFIPSKAGMVCVCLCVRKMRS